MKEVIKHGYMKFRTRCTSCDCYFSYDIDDVNKHIQVTCPECGGVCYHNTINKDLTSQRKDEQ